MAFRVNPETRWTRAMRVSLSPRSTTAGARPSTPHTTSESVNALSRLTDNHFLAQHMLRLSGHWETQEIQFRWFFMFNLNLSVEINNFIIFNEIFFLISKNLKLTLSECCFTSLGIILIFTAVGLWRLEQRQINWRQIGRSRGSTSDRSERTTSRRARKTQVCTRKSNILFSKSVQAEIFERC